MTFDPSIANGQTIMDVLQLQATLAGYSLVDPDGVTIEPASGLAVDVTFSTEARLGGPAESVADVTGHSIPDSDPNDPRKVLLYLDANGNVQSIAGDAAGALPEGEERARAGVPDVPIPDEPFLPLAEIWLAADADSLSSSDISSRRMPFEQGEGSGVNADLLRGSADYTTTSEASDAAPVQSVDGKEGDVVTDYSDFQRFDTVGVHTWEKPDGVNWIKVDVIGGGGDGNVSGGGGGGRIIQTIFADEVPSDVSITVGDSSETSTFGAIIDESFRLGGGNGDDDDGGNGGGDIGILYSGSGSSGDADWGGGGGGGGSTSGSGAGGGSSLYGGGGGGGGGAGDGGGGGGAGLNFNDGSSEGENGEDGDLTYCGGGGGGGGGGGDGGDGGVPGGGGGGSTDGVGGDGARGEVRVWAW